MKMQFCSAGVASATESTEKKICQHRLVVLIEAVQMVVHSEVGASEFEFLQVTSECLQISIPHEGRVRCECCPRLDIHKVDWGFEVEGHFLLR